MRVGLLLALDAGEEGGGLGADGHAGGLEARRAGFLDHVKEEVLQPVAGRLDGDFHARPFEFVNPVHHLVNRGRRSAGRW